MIGFNITPYLMMIHELYSYDVFSNYKFYLGNFFLVLMFTISIVHYNLAPQTSSTITYFHKGEPHSSIIAWFSQP